MGFDIVFFLQTIVAGISAIPLSLFIAFTVMIIGTLFGLPIALLMFYRVRYVEPVFKVIVTIIQGIPILVFYLIFYIILSQYSMFNSISVAIISLSFPGAIRMAEVFRGALESVNRNQFDAAYSVGHTTNATIARIIMPQIIPVIIPPSGNICIQMIKSVAVASLIGVNDILNTCLLEATINYRYLESYFAAGLIFWGVFIVIERVFYLIETHYKKQICRELTT
jgi:L-cystine transport system permease protein